MGNLNLVSSREMQEAIAQFSQDRETGIIQITLGKQDKITLLIQNGKIPYGYLNTKEHHRRILNTEWQQLLETEDKCSVIFDPKPSATLLPQKILLEYQGQAEEKQFSTSQLVSLIHSSEKRQIASIHHIRWQRAEAFVISSGTELSQRKSLLLTNDMILETPDALQQIFNWHETECIATTYEGNIESPTWLEIYLNILFEWACNHILDQYSYLTGKVMIHSVIRNLLVKAFNEGWEITATDGRVIDHTIFESPVEESRAYRAMFNNIYKSIEPIIGPVLLFSIQRQINTLCKGNYLSIARMYELF
ncbi:MAG: hypothetical protein JW963_25695 [Anaerolineales bacterium]|nr:hypothetical protein [Anaerolineales bacterium]